MDKSIEYDAYLAVGSNLGDKNANLDLVIRTIEEDNKIWLVKKSTWIETKPYGVTDQPDFLNGVVKVRTTYTPQELLGFCKSMEQKSGRVKTRHWGERTLDVDILIYGDEIILEENLKIPHPEMHLRDFVLKPLLEIEPNLIHPIKNMNIIQLHDLLYQ
ncbi:MAG: 2-amino-4-hydroxy-6-hydroxymethyldihydropteridine diphosphokinase [Epulopiscium sp. Nuni2H_MBin003]|nr:MAG: 2-amino-4-hydroxy-6-hydroxymethyldihydropteridine diphosphokinase [Epulopiscium sp. Nuni2H_MBin003]